jgi:hypothetical protein
MNALAQNPVNALVQGLYGKAQQAADYIGKRYQALKTDPLGDVQKTMQGTIDRGAMRDALHAKAFGNPKNPLEITDPEAFNELMDQAQSDVTSFAPAGMLRLGGRQDLIASHGTSARGLLNEDGKLIPELTHMSAAIQKGQLANTWGNVSLIVRPNKLDPATSPSIIHTQDAMTPTSWGSHLFTLLDKAPTPTLNQLATARMQDRFAREYPKGGSNPDLEGQAVLANRRFNSYAGYEKSPQGAALLRAPGELHYPADVQAFVQAVESLGHPKGLAAGLQEVMQAPGQTFAGFDKYDMFQKLRTNPQPYAELKSFGQTPLNSDTFAGAIIKAPMQAPFLRSSLAERASIYNVRKALEARGIPVQDSLNVLQDFQAAIQMQKATR